MSATDTRRVADTSRGRVCRDGTDAGLCGDGEHNTTDSTAEDIFGNRDDLGRIKVIPLTRGKSAIVDAEDYPMLSRVSWHTRGSKDGKHFYAACGGHAFGEGSNLMHRIILGLKKGEVTDHINGNGLDNRKCNLRACTQRQNMWNNRRQTGDNPFRGVYYKKRDRNWESKLSMPDGTDMFIGVFNDPKEAALAWDSKARELRGEFAVCNFPEDSIDFVDEPHVCPHGVIIKKRTGSGRAGRSCKKCEAERYKMWYTSHRKAPKNVCEHGVEKFSWAKYASKCGECKKVKSAKRYGS